MAQQNTDGIDSDIDTTTADTTVSEPSSEEKANTDNLGEDQNLDAEENLETDPKTTPSDEEDYETLLQKLKDDGVSLNKINRFKKLVEKSQKIPELEARLKEFEAVKTEAKEDVKQDKQHEDSQSSSTDDFAELDTVLEGINVDDKLFSDLENLQEGDFNSWKDIALLMYKPMRKAILRDLTKVREVGQQKELEQKQSVGKYYNELDQKVKDTFTDESGNMDSNSYEEYMATLKSDHSKKPVESVEKHLLNYLKSKALSNKTLDKAEKEEESNPVAGRNTRKTTEGVGYTPGSRDPFGSI